MLLLLLLLVSGGAGKAGALPGRGAWGQDWPTLIMCPTLPHFKHGSLHSASHFNGTELAGRPTNESVTDSSESSEKLKILALLSDLHSNIHQSEEGLGSKL